MSALLPAAIRFRSRVIDATGRDLDRFWYLDRDHVLAVCPACDGPLGIRFAGTAPRCDFNCRRGCTEADIAERLGLRVTPR